MRMRMKLLLALCLLAALAVMVVADGTTQAKEKQLTAYQQDSKNTEAKLKGALTLSDKAKVKAKPKKAKKPAKTAKAKPAEPSPTQKYPSLDAKTAQYVVDCDRRIEVYTEAADKAREKGDEDLAQLYLAAAGKERAKKAAIIKPEPGKEDNQAVQQAAKKESAAFNKIVDRTDKKQLTAEEKRYLRDEVITPLDASTLFFQQFLENALKPLLQQYLGSPGAVIGTASTIHSIASGGCATPSSAVSTGMAVAGFVIPLLRSLVDLVEFFVTDTRQTVTNLNMLVN